MITELNIGETINLYGIENFIYCKVKKIWQKDGFNFFVITGDRIGIILNENVDKFDSIRDAVEHFNCLLLAGVGNYYGPFDAQNIFDNFQKEEIVVNILKYPEVVYNPNRQKHVFINEYPDEEKVSFSDTKLRNKIKIKSNPLNI